MPRATRARTPASPTPAPARTPKPHPPPAGAKLTHREMATSRTRSPATSRPRRRPVANGLPPPHQHARLGAARASSPRGNARRPALANTSPTTPPDNAVQHGPAPVTTNTIARIGYVGGSKSATSKLPTSGSLHRPMIRVKLDGAAVSAPVHPPGRHPHLRPPPPPPPGNGARCTGAPDGIAVHPLPAHPRPPLPARPRPSPLLGPASDAGGTDDAPDDITAAGGTATTGGYRQQCPVHLRFPNVWSVGFGGVSMSTLINYSSPQMHPPLPNPPRDGNGQKGTDPAHRTCLPGSRLGIATCAAVYQHSPPWPLSWQNTRH